MENNETDLSVAFTELGKKCKEALEPVIEGIIKLFKDVWEQIKPKLNFLDKQISRKRFIKLLMSRGVQRNEANKIAWKIHKEKGKYTILDYLLTVEKEEE